MPRICILACVFNDWSSADKLASAIDEELGKAGLVADLVFVNDGSTEQRPASFCSSPYRSIPSITVVHARTNLGHQRAIALGLWYVHRHREADCIAVMDSDGEDKPSDLVRLIEAWRSEGGARVVFAARAKRSEGLLFRAFYSIYKLLHSTLTGRKITFGNFSVLSRHHVETLLVEPDLWNHYAAAVVKTKLAYVTIPTHRGTRYYGASKLNFTALVIHGLSALSCFKEVIAVRLIIASLAAMALLIALAAIVAAIKIFSDVAVKGWATTAFGMVVVVFTQLLAILALFVIGLLGSRNQYSFMPIRDCEFFLERRETIRAPA